MGIDYTYKTDKFVEEVRLASTGERLDWLVGAFYTSEDSKNTQIVKGYDLDGALTPINWGTVILPSSYDEFAGFATLNFHATSKLDLQAGLRYSHNSQEQEQKGSGLLVGSAPKRHSSESPVTYLGNASYRASDNLMAYLRIASDRTIDNLMNLRGAHILYGRRNTLSNPAGEPLAEIVEILPPTA